MNSELRHTNCELSFAKEIWFGNDVRQLGESAKEFQNGLSGALRRPLGRPNRPRRGSLGPTKGQVRSTGCCQMGLISSDQAFWDDFGVQMEGFTRSISIRSRRATSFRGNSDFVQPSYGFSLF